MSELGWQAWREQALQARLDARQLRQAQPLQSIDATHARLGPRELTLFSTNDYLGLSSHEHVREAVARAALAHGQGARGSALICGYSDEHARLEFALAQHEGKACALLTPTGYAANVATLTALASSPDVTIFSDSLNHASIIDGVALARRAGARLCVFAHGDLAQLRDQLQRCDSPRKLIVTDGVFSMDGDLAPLRELAAFKRDHDALLVVDDAHGTLVLGPQGRGTAHELGVSDDVDVTVGTLSKAIGAQGGFVATSERWRALILNLGRPYIYSTALPTPVVAGALAALEVNAREGDALRARLSAHLARAARALGRTSQTPILPVIVGDEDRALSLSASLLRAGYHVTAIRPPTVPAGTARLRVTLSAAHAEDEVQGLLDALVTLR